MHRVGIAGYRGYSGVELTAILRQHPSFEPVWLEHRSDSSARPEPRRAASIDKIDCTAEAARSADLGAVMLATPPEASMELAQEFLAAGMKVVDLSGAFRLKTIDNFVRWYPEKHTAPDLLATAVYGLPEFYREAVRGAKLVANPGCYPTAANLAIAPLVSAGVVDRAAGIICDAKSGVSGAGRKPSLKTSFCEVTENFSAYSILQHRHVPEVLMNSQLEEREFSFTAQLIPVNRGILETIYIKTPASAADLIEIYEARYANEPFVRLYDPGVVPDLQSVTRTNFCDIGVVADPSTGRAVIVAAIDNLVKGAAGQAVQNLNLLFGIDETAGLR
jgi:N-acetyl-gamma-glutamyl-phosphate reductase